MLARHRLLRGWAWKPLLPISYLHTPPVINKTIGGVKQLLQQLQQEPQHQQDPQQEQEEQEEQKQKQEQEQGQQQQEEED
ncbi:hypothetical protein VYU27_001344 [Nannochloropsis oceanica]